MKITSIKPRRDGKLLVSLLFTFPDSCKTLRKVVTREQLDAMQSTIRNKQSNEDPQHG